MRSGKTIKKSQLPSYSSLFGNTLEKLAENDKKIIAVSAAMCSGTGLNGFAKKYPERFFDVGIAEQHAVSFSAAMAKSGYKPVFAVYSTFLQRAYDEIMQDVCLQNLHVVFGVDRAGIVGSDGETHQGIYDISYFRHMPNMTVMLPKNGYELEQMEKFALMNMDSPVAIRYPRGEISTVFSDIKTPIEIGKSEVIKDGEKIAVISAGAVMEQAAGAVRLLEKGGYRPMLVNLRFVKPLDVEMLKNVCEKCSYIFTIEDNVSDGGAGSGILEKLADEELIKNIYFHSFAFPDKFIEHGTRKELFERYRLDSESIYSEIKKRVENNG